MTKKKFVDHWGYSYFNKNEKTLTWAEFILSSCRISESTRNSNKMEGFRI